MQGTFESSSYYYFHKILGIPNYIIGKRTQTFIESYLQYYKSSNLSKEKESSEILPKAVNNKIFFYENNYKKP